MTASNGAKQPISIQMSGDLGTETLDDVLGHLIAASVADYLPERRWFGHKQRPIAAVCLLERAVMATGADLFALCIVRVDFEEGASADYFLPLALSADVPESSVPLVSVTAGNGQFAVIDAPTLPVFRRWLADELSHQGVSLGIHGQFAWIGPAGDAGAASIPDAERSRIVSAEQSNTSIIYGQSAILKLFRRISVGPNPDAELGRFLTSQTNFMHTPPFLGELRYTDAAGEISSLAVAQGYVANVGDGWNHTVASISATRPDSSFVEDARLLGVRTAQMHLALASDHADSDMRPEPVTDTDVAAWSASLEASLGRVDRALEAVSHSVATSISDPIFAFRQALGGFRSRAEGLSLLIGKSKTRVHGDFHLGQTLRTPDGDFVILDFEGEPQRTIDERRAKTSPLKDVAGMLRSFGYARGTAERESDSSAIADLVAWERSTREAFLSAYFDEASASSATFLPDTREDFREALNPWELDKALYEIEYEINNRPDWLWLPLTATLKLA